jgi:hypothetical protein
MGATDNDGYAPAVTDSLDRGRCGLCKLSGRESGAWVGDVDEMMVDALTILVRRFVGADVEPAVHSEGVGRDDLAVEAYRGLEAEQALPGGGRTQNDKQGSG